MVKLARVILFILVPCAMAGFLFGVPLAVLASAVPRDCEPTQGAQDENRSIPLEASPSSNPDEWEARAAKNRRFNGGRFDLTRSEAVFVEHYAPRVLPTIPLKDSGIVFVGSVSRIQPYLSEDRTHIYTEMTFCIEDMIKNPVTLKRASEATVVTDSIGGTLRLRSGHVVRDDTESDIGGKLYAGGRYVVFVKVQAERDALEIVKAYELRDGRVFKLTKDGSRGKTVLSRTPGKEDAFSVEASLLELVQEETKNSQ